VCLAAAADGCFKVDLKGVLYQATVLPLAGTALVANIGPTEAKVGRESEALCTLEASRAAAVVGGLPGLRQGQLPKIWHSERLGCEPLHFQA